MADQSTIARPYARAVFDLARAAGMLSQWSDGLAAGASVVANEAASEYLSEPRLTAADRAKFVGGVCASIDSAAILSTNEGHNFLRLLAENGRLEVLPEIAAQFDALKTRAENKIKVTLVSAVEADPAVTARIARALSERLGREVELEVELDERLIGGAIVRADDRVIDGSVRSRLERLAGTLID